MAQSSSRTTAKSRPQRPKRHEPKEVVAVVDRYFKGKGYGFATVTDGPSKGRRVFFHKDYCRTVKVTDKPVLTREHTAPQVAGNESSTPSEVLMLIVPVKGRCPKAIAWGVILKPSWLRELAQKDHFKTFVNGHVRSRSVNGKAFNGTEYDGILERVEVTANHLVIVLANPRQRNSVGNYVDMGQTRLELRYELDSIRPAEQTDAGCFAIRVRDNGSDRRVNFERYKD